MAKSTHALGIAVWTVANLISYLPGKNYSEEVQDILNWWSNHVKAVRNGDFLRFEKWMEHELWELEPGKHIYLTHAIAAIVEFLAFHQDTQEVQVFADELGDTGLMRTFHDLGFWALCVAGKNTFVIKITDKNGVSKKLLGTERH